MTTAKASPAALAIRASAARSVERPDSEPEPGRAGREVEQGQDQVDARRGQAVAARQQLRLRQQQGDRRRAAG